MNIKVVIGIVILISVIVAGNWFYASREAYSPLLESSEAQGSSVGQTFAQLLAIGQSLECTYEYVDGANVGSGTMYMTNGGEKIRGDFNFTQSGAGAMQMHMIRADGYNYMWGSQLPQGIKVQVTEENKDELFDSFGGQDVSAINNTNYTCSAWNGDSSKFAIPTDVQFMDLSEMQKMMGAPKIGEATRETGGSGGTPDIKAMQCAACDQAGAAREQCRQALGCK